MGRSRRGSAADRIGIETVVPGQPPIRLVAYYPHMVDYYRTCALQTKAWFTENIRQDWVCIDVGANLGYMAIAMARQAPSGRVLALEPTSTYQMLLENIQANHLTNINPYQLGVSDRSFSGTESLYRIWGEGPEETHVQFVALDDFVTAEGLQRVDLIKIDTDGFELEVLRGALGVLQEYSPVVVVELSHALATRGHTVSECMELLLDCKYADALVLDRENYLFSRTWELGQAWPRSMAISFDRRAPQESFEAIPKAGSIRDLGLAPRSHNGARVEDSGAWCLTGPAWSYVVTFDLPPEALRFDALRVTLSVEDGDAGIFLSDAHGQRILGVEKFVSAGQTQDVLLPAPESTTALLIVRKATGRDLKVRVGPISACGIELRATSGRELSDLTAAELETVLGMSVGESWAETPLAHVTSVTAPELASALGLVALTNIGTGLIPANQLVMERDDAPILEWLYRALSPSRHFEFGTWEGFGTLLCLRSTGAEVWTVNPPEGEFRDGVSAYPRSREPQLAARFLNTASQSADSGDAVGWMYRAAGHTDRVHQLLCSSEHLPSMELPWATFDTVLIDGSHDRDMVRKDQATAQKLVKPGGVIIWHDFSLDQGVVEAQPSTKGVIAAVADDMLHICEGRDLLWVRDSMILLSVPSQPQGTE